MSNDIAIELKNVSKVFKRYHHPVDRLKEIFLPTKPQVDEFWALQNIDLTLYKGESFGIVGKNGAGKSTLLQIMSKVLSPTTGTVNVNGKIAALLELGSGFNPEFTGRQNIFFNGQILGLNSDEIQDKLENIISFADIGDFIDQPVKTYSSGMTVRLAFAVSIHLEPEVLIVDEALAVGDIGFVGKCLNKVEEFISKGKTLIVVSHDLNVVKNMTHRALFLESGEVKAYGPSQEVVALYKRSFKFEADTKDKFERYDQEIKIQKALLLSTKERKPIEAVRQNEPAILHFQLFSNEVCRDLRLRFSVYNYLGIIVFSGDSKRQLGAIDIGGPKVIEIHLDELLLSPGKYTVNVSISNMDSISYLAWWKTAVCFDVLGANEESYVYAQPQLWTCEP